MSTKPEKTIRIGLISASIFLNEIDTADGKKALRNVHLQRRYRDEAGEWKTKNSFLLSDLPVAIAVLKRAFDYIAAQEADRQNGTPNSPLQKSDNE